MQKTRTNLFLFSTILLLSISFGNVSAQNSLNSPYSRFGFGEISALSMHPYNNSMGGLSQAIRSDNMLNPQNPASFSEIKSGSFIFDMGFLGEMSRLKANGQQSKTEGVANISHISFGFPILSKYKMSFGLMPFSQVEYSSSQTNVRDSLGRVKESFSGTGGVNKIYWGHGVQITKGLSVGTNINLLFGKTDKTAAIEFLDSTMYRNVHKKDIINVSDFTGSLGAQYRFSIKEKNQLTLGITYTPSIKFNASVDEMRYSYSSTGVDTSVNDNVKKSIRMPQSIAAGIAYEQKNKWLVGFDITYTEWSKHLFLDEPLEFKKDNFLMSLGGELKGDLSAMKYWNRISWRGGAHLESAKYVVDNQNVDDMGVHLGASFPIRRARSMISLSLMYGKLGGAEGLIQRDYFKIGVSFSACDRWFMQRKFD